MNRSYISWLLWQSVLPEQIEAELSGSGKSGLQKLREKNWRGSYWMSGHFLYKRKMEEAMRKYHGLCALFISLLLGACGNAGDTTNMEPQNPTEPIQQEPLSEGIMFHSPEIDVMLAVNLTNLKALFARNCGNSDISVLSGPTQLEELDLGKNRFCEERQDDLITVTQTGRLREDMPEFQFRLTAYYDLQRESYALQTVEVYQDDTRLQIISIPELTMGGETCILDSLQDTLGFELEDVNFDGYQDIRLFDTLNGNYRTEWIYLVWNVEEQKFENDTRLNQISLAGFDQEEQLIYGMERSGAVNHYYSTYQYIDGEIVRIHYYEEEGLFLSDEQIRHYYDAASVKTDGEAFEAWYEHVMERNAVSGELETVSEEYVFKPYDSAGKVIESGEELRIDVSSGLGAQISEDISR